MTERASTKCPTCGSAVPGDSGSASGAACPRCTTGLKTFPDAGLSSIADGPPPGKDPLIGTSLGQFRILRCLGRGGNGAVYEAEDQRLGRRVALKAMLPEVLNKSATAAERFAREARMTSRLNHPNIVGIHFAGVDNGVTFIVMPLISGGSAQDRLEDGKGFEPLEATRIARSAARGLAAAHAMGIVHRDVKPANIMIRDDGEAMVTDFGMAKMADRAMESLTAPGAVVGTPNYMSPEQCRDDDVDGRSDLYSLGATYFALLTGRPPFRGGGALGLAYKHLTEPHPDPRSVNPSVPSLCVRIIDKAMAKEPAARYRNAEEMAAALQAVEDSLRARQQLLDEADRAATPGETVMLGERAVAEMLDAESTSDEIDVGESDLEAGRLAFSQAVARAQAQPRPATPAPSREPDWMSLPAFVAFKFLFPGPSEARGALGYVRQDIRDVAKKVIGTTILKGQKRAFLDISVGLPPKELFGLAKSLIAGGGQYMGLKSDDGAVAEWLRKQLGGLRKT